MFFCILKHRILSLYVKYSLAVRACLLQAGPASAGRVIRSMVIMLIYSVKDIWLKSILMQPKGIEWSLLRLICRGLSHVYGLLVHIRHTLYQRNILKKRHVPPNNNGSVIKIISIGNITAGGTGKTPMVAHVAGWLAAQGHKTAILTRGYGRIPKARNQKDDEAFIMHRPGLQNVVRLTGWNRYQMASNLAKQGTYKAIVLDDGFQHMRLARDLNIVMINSLDPFGHKRLLPYGTLREPLNNLNRTDLFVLTHTNLCTEQDKIETINYLNQFGKPVIETMYQPVEFMSLLDSNKPACQNEAAGRQEPLSALTHQSVWGFCGIGDPLGFKKTLEKIGIQLKGFSIFADHYPYKIRDVEQLIARARANGVDRFVTTEKDMARLRWLKTHLDHPGKLVTGLLDYVSHRLLPIYALKIELVITQNNALLEKSLNKLFL